jgi:hypothetical protein
MNRGCLWRDERGKRSPAESRLRAEARPTSARQVARRSIESRAAHDDSRSLEGGTRSDGLIACATCLLLFSLALAGADLRPDFLAAAKKGQTQHLQALLGKGASLDARDKDGRTPLMLAAEHGHADTVRFLLDRGAKPEERDHQGWTAFGLAFISSAGGREEVLKALPRPATTRVVVEATMILDHLYSSCLTPEPRLAAQFRALHPEELLAASIREAATGDTRHPPIELVADRGDATLQVRLHPRVVCVLQQSADKLNLEADVQLAWTGQSAPVFEKAFGKGLKGLGEQLVSSTAQYPPVFQEWTRKQGAPIYQDMVEALLRHPAPNAGR